jgi:hypothetical protein
MRANNNLSPEAILSSSEYGCDVEKVTIEFTKFMYQELIRVAARNRMSVSELVREAVVRLPMSADSRLQKNFMVSAAPKPTRREKAKRRKWLIGDWDTVEEEQADE